MHLNWIENGKFFHTWLILAVFFHVFKGLISIVDEISSFCHVDLYFPFSLLINSVLITSFSELHDARQILFLHLSISSNVNFADSPIKFFVFLSRLMSLV